MNAPGDPYPISLRSPKIRGAYSLLTEVYLVVNWSKELREPVDN